MPSNPMQFHALLPMLFLIPVAVLSQPRLDSTINTGWKFLRRDVTHAESTTVDDSRWETVSLPHTWNALDGQDGGNDYYRGVGWYRTWLSLTAAYRGRDVFLRFEAASTVAHVFVNGKLAGIHRGGFGAFCFEITRLVSEDSPNLIAVMVDNARDTTVSPLSGDFTVFGGLYRRVDLIGLNKLSISPLDDASSGVYLTQKSVTPASADIDIGAVLRNSSEKEKTALVRCTIKDRDGKEVKRVHATALLGPASQRTFVQNVTFPAPHLWDGKRDPYLYTVSVEVLEGSEVKDRVVQPLGLRSFRIDPGKGFFLNGRPYSLHGVNRHQDRLNMGWAITRKEHEEDYRLIAELGCTAVRLAHYQHAQEFSDLCDSGGTVVWAELALVDEIHPCPGFAANCITQLSELIKQNYNHPSIVMWSLSNELIPDADRPLYGRVMSALNARAKGLDPYRLTTLASRSNYDGNEFVNTVTDVLGYNEYKGWYEGAPQDVADYVDDLHRRFPSRAFCISEYGAGAGISQHEIPPSKHDTRGNWHPEEWQSRVHEIAWNVFASRPFIWGTFVWNMFDFASDGRSEGELSGRNDKGLVTYDRKVKKDAFYWYKAHWNPEPMVHIASKRFTPRPAGSTTVTVYSNCDSLQLTINGKSLGTLNSREMRFVWSDVDLRPGENILKAHGRKDGTEVDDTCTWVTVGH